MILKMSKRVLVMTLLLLSQNGYAKPEIESKQNACSQVVDGVFDLSKATGKVLDLNDCKALKSFRGVAPQTLIDVAATSTNLEGNLNLNMFPKLRMLAVGRNKNLTGFTGDALELTLLQAEECNLYGNLKLSQFRKAKTIDIHSNANLTGFLGAAPDATTILASHCNISGSLDIENLFPKAINVDLSYNKKLTGVLGHLYDLQKLSVKGCGVPPIDHMQFPRARIIQ